VAGAATPPVEAAGAALAAAESAVGVAAAGAALGVAAAVVSVAGCFSPPHAPRMVALAMSAIPWNRMCGKASKWT
jgi:hypothetical protein